MANSPTDSVRIALFNEKNVDEFLILDESDDVGNYKLPGGKFDSEDETPSQCALREILEELGIGPNEIQLSQVANLLNDDGVSRRYIFTALIDAGLPRPSNEVNTCIWTRTVPEGKNSKHIDAAIGAAREVLKT